MIFEIKINNYVELSHLSIAYVKQELKLNISKLARKLKYDRKTVKNYLKGLTDILITFIILWNESLT